MPRHEAKGGSASVKKNRAKKIVGGKAGQSRRRLLQKLIRCQIL